MNNENVCNNIMTNNDTSLDKCNRDMSNRGEDAATSLDDDENDNSSLESQMSTTSNRQSSSDSVGRRQSKDIHQEQQQEQQGNTNDDDDVDTPFKDGSSEEEVEPPDVRFSSILFDDKKLSWHLEQALSIILRLGSAVLGDQYDDLLKHLKQVEENRVSSISSIQEYFEFALYQEEIKQCQDAASEGLSDYISSLKDEEESDGSSESPLFEEDDESMLSSGSKGKSDESFPSSSSKKRGRGYDDKEDGDPPPRPRKQRSRLSKAASDDESQDESQMHEKDQDDDETEQQSQSKANKQQEKEAKDKEKAELQEKEEDAKYEAIPEAYKQVKNESLSSDKRAIMAVVTNANDKTSDLIGALFDPSNPNRIGKLRLIFRYYMTTLLPSIRANSMLLSRSKAKADGLASVVGLGGDASLSKFLLCCDSDNDEVQDEDPRATEEWEQVREAILECGTKLSVEEFLALGVDTRNMLMHFLHSQALQFIFSEITLSGITAHLSAKASAALTSAMKELAQLVDPDAPFALTMVVLSFMKQYALPGLGIDSARRKAVDVIIDIFGSLTYVGRSEDQKKAYKKNILTPFENVDASTISGGRVEGKVSKYFSSNKNDTKMNKVCQERRKNVVRLGLALYLKSAIEDLLDMRGSGQYTRGILRLSASDISRKFTKDITKTLFRGEEDSKAKVVENMKKLVLKKKPKSRTLLIESDEQKDCLMHLIDLLRTFSEA